MIFPSEFPLDNENHAERTVFDALKKLRFIFCRYNQMNCIDKTLIKMVKGRI
jgi:hypothetical protein